MAKNQNKTQETDASVDEYLMQIENDEKRADCFRIREMMERIVGAPAKMWGTAIIGFGNYHYRYESGREGDFMITGFSPRKQALTVYIMAGFGRFDALMKKLGKYKTGKSCLYIKQLSDVDEKVLQKLIDESVRYMRKNYETK